MTSALDGMLDRLHAAPLSEFVVLRKALSRELAERGDKKAAAALLLVKKPPITAWALNQVALKAPHELDAFLAATEKLRAAQQRALAGGNASDFRESGRELQRQLGVVIGLARKALESAGHRATTTQARRIGQSLHSTPFAAPDDLARLAAGHLEADLDVPVDFGIFTPGARREHRAAAVEREHAPAEAKTKQAPADTKTKHALSKTTATAAQARSASKPARADERKRALADKRAEQQAEKQRAAATARAEKEEAVRDVPPMPPRTTPAPPPRPRAPRVSARGRCNLDGRRGGRRWRSRRSLPSWRFGSSVQSVAVGRPAGSVDAVLNRH